MRNNVKSILLASGGLDSTTLAYWLRHKRIRFTPLFIDYGQHCAATERKTLAALLPKNESRRIKTINIEDVYKGSQSLLIREVNLWKHKTKAEDLYLPYRNLLLLSAGAAFAQSRGVSFLYAAFINSNHAKEIDCSTKFFDELSKVLREYGSVTIRMPFRKMSKRQVANIGLKLRVPIASTFSCQAASVVPCGACPNCVDRLDALRSFG
jgi:7-cyano-7-deazaguanine synthase